MGLLLPPHPRAPSSASPGALRGGSRQHCKSPEVHETKIQGIFRDPEGFVRARAPRRFGQGPCVCGAIGGTGTASELRICGMERVLLSLAPPDPGTRERALPGPAEPLLRPVFSKP